MASGSITESLRQTLAVFEGDGEPLTTTEVAECLDVGRRSTYERLERLVDAGRLRTKKVGASARVWWRPSGAQRRDACADRLDSSTTATDDHGAVEEHGSAAAGHGPGAPGTTDGDARRSTVAESLRDDLLDGVEVGVFVLDSEFHVAWINEATERYFGVDREDVLGRDKRRLVRETVAPVVELRREHGARPTVDAHAADGTDVDAPAADGTDIDALAADGTDVDAHAADGTDVDAHAAGTDDDPPESGRDGPRDGPSSSFAETVLATYDDNTYAERFLCRVHPAEDREERWLEHRSKPIESGAYAGGRVELYYDVTEAQRSELARQELELRREELAALDELNQVAREITDAVLDRSTREEIERAVCERLAGSQSYLFAWIGDVDVDSQTVNLRYEAGVEGYLDGITISVDPEDERSSGPTGRAVLQREVQTTRDMDLDDRHDPWRGHVEEYGLRSSAAVPIVHEDTLYGVLNVYAERPAAFEGRERTVIAQLGEVVGHAIAAAERKRALMSDEVVELQFRLRDVFDALGVDRQSDGTITLDHAVPAGGETYLVYGTATPDAVDDVEALVDALDHWRGVTYRSTDDESGTTGADGRDGSVDSDRVADGPSSRTGDGPSSRTGDGPSGRTGDGPSGRTADEPLGFQVELSEPPVLSTVTSLGGSVERVVAEDGDYRMTIHAAPGADVREIVDVVRSIYPSAELLKQRQVRREDGSAARVQRVLSTDLTDCQRAALEAAYYAGFFAWPRDASGEHVAESLGVSPATFHQHLRSAERKVLASLLEGDDA